MRRPTKLEWWGACMVVTIGGSIFVSLAWSISLSFYPLVFWLGWAAREVFTHLDGPTLEDLNKQP